MSSFRFLIPALAVCHLTAITIASVPPPGDIRPSTSVTSVPNHWPANILGPALDRVAAGAASTQRIWELSSPLRRLAGAYTRTIGLEQRWNMFAEPPDTNHYARMRYYIRSSAGAQGIRADRELVFPARRGDQVPFFRASYYEEKAVRSARQRFYRRLQARPEAKRLADLPQDLLPVVRYYTARYRNTLLDGETLTRAELWLGSAPVPPPGAAASGDGDRDAVLRAYYEGPQSTWRAKKNQPVGTSEREADVTWTLIYFEEYD